MTIQDTDKFFDNEDDLIIRDDDEQIKTDITSKPVGPWTHLVALSIFKDESITPH